MVRKENSRIFSSLGTLKKFLSESCPVMYGHQYWSIYNLTLILIHVIVRKNPWKYFILIFRMGYKMEIQNDICHWASDAPPPRNDINFHPFFTPLFSFAIKSFFIWNGFYTWSQSKVSLLGPLIIGSKLTFSGCFDRRQPYLAMFNCSYSPHT